MRCGGMKNFSLSTDWLFLFFSFDGTMVVIVFSTERERKNALKLFAFEWAVNCWRWHFNLNKLLTFIFYLLLFTLSWINPLYHLPRIIHLPINQRLFMGN